MNIRRFNEAGTLEYKKWLISMKEEDEQELPNHLLEDDEYTEVIDSEIEDREFLNTREFGDYVNGILSESYLGDYGMWNWLSCYYLKYLLPLKNNSRQRPGSINRYLVIENEAFAGDPFRRHLVAMPALFTRAHEGESEILNVILSQTNIGTYGDMQEQTLATQEYYYCRPILKTLHRLYYDTDNNRLKSGAATDVRRFIDVVGSLGYTHNFTNITVDQLIDLLPSEFDRWLQ
jgi:hypothetical protein